MIAPLPDLSAPTGWPHAAGTPTAPAVADEGMGLDFAGLLGAAFVPSAPPTLPEGGNTVAGEGEPALPTGPAAPFTLSNAALAASPLTGLPVPHLTGKIVPEGGASLPPAMLAPVPAAMIPAEVVALASPSAVRPLPNGDALPADPVAADGLPADVPGQPPALVPSTLAGEAVAAPTPGPHPATSRASQAEDATDETDANAPAPADTDTSMPPADPALLAALVTPPAAPAALAPARLQRAGPLTPADRAIAPMPARVILPSAAGRTPPAEDAPEVQGASLSASPSPSAPPPPLLPATDSPPQPSQPVQSASAIAAAPATHTAPMPDRIEAPRTPAPQQESAIAQVGDLREALRSARPEMTLRHAEFGFVSLRLEQPAPEQWRAVLASRDPGFVPAIQAALAERAVAAASASADSGHFMGQNGTSDQRYGASPNGAQGGLSPYLGQSGGRDGEAAPDHRRPSTAAALAARGQDGEEASGSEARGLFA